MVSRETLSRAAEFVLDRVLRTNVRSSAEGTGEEVVEKMYNDTADGVAEFAREHIEEITEGFVIRCCARCCYRAVEWLTVGTALFGALMQIVISIKGATHAPSYREERGVHVTLLVLSCLNMTCMMLHLGVMCDACNCLPDYSQYNMFGIRRDKRKQRSVRCVSVRCLRYDFPMCMYTASIALMSVYGTFSGIYYLTRKTSLERSQGYLAINVILAVLGFYIAIGSVILVVLGGRPVHENHATNLTRHASDLLLDMLIHDE